MVRCRLGKMLSNMSIIIRLVYQIPWTKSWLCEGTFSIIWNVLKFNTIPHCGVLENLDFIAKMTKNPRFFPWLEVHFLPLPTSISLATFWTLNDCCLFLCYRGGVANGIFGHSKGKSHQKPSRVASRQGYLWAAEIAGSRDSERSQALSYLSQ